MNKKNVKMYRRVRRQDLHWATKACEVPKEKPTDSTVTDAYIKHMARCQSAQRGLRTTRARDWNVTFTEVGNFLFLPAHTLPSAQRFSTLTKQPVYTLTKSQDDRPNWTLSRPELKFLGIWRRRDEVNSKRRLMSTYVSSIEIVNWDHWTQRYLYEKIP